MQCLIDFVLLLAGICGARYCFRGAPERPPMKVICLVGLIRSLVLKSVFSRCVLFVVCLIFERTIFDVYLTDWDMTELQSIIIPVPLIIFC